MENRGAATVCWLRSTSRPQSKCRSPFWQVWVLDALPGEVRAGDAQRRDHPADLIVRLQQLTMPVETRSALQSYLVGHGFSDHIAKWASTNLKAVDGDARCAESHPRSCCTYLPVWAVRCLLLERSQEAVRLPATCHSSIAAPGGGRRCQELGSPRGRSVTAELRQAPGQQTRLETGLSGLQAPDVEL